MLMFHALLSEASPLENPTPDEFAQKIYWELQDAEHLLAVFSRSKQMILAGFSSGHRQVLHCESVSRVRCS